MSARAKPVRKPPRLRLEVDERRAQLLALGRRFFSAQSYDEVSIDAVAKDAGISKGLLYHYFPTKRDFYLATIRDAARELLDLTAPSEELEPIDRAQAGLDAYLGYVEQHALAYAALFRSGIGADPEVFALVEATRAQFLNRVLAGLDSKGRDVTPAMHLALRGWVGFVEAASIEWAERRHMTRTALRDLLVQVLLATIQIAMR
jgi:AcrR family transcriptional regulator